jgi:hypothetical protein
VYEALCNYEQMPFEEEKKEISKEEKQEERERLRLEK